MSVKSKKLCRRFGPYCREIGSFESSNTRSRSNTETRKYACEKWVYSGDALNGAVELGEAGGDILECDRMLGIMWEPSEDIFKLTIRINLTPLKNKSRT